MQILQVHLASEYGALVKHVLYTIRNLSDAATAEENIEEMLKMLLVLLECDDIDMVVCSAGILSNLTCNNQRNKVALSLKEY